MQAYAALTRPLPHVARIGLAALAYFAAARLSLALAIPPGYATAVWPPSGLALAAMLLMGNGIWPAIWLGAALANVGVESSFLSAAAIASGNTLEALVGAVLIRRNLGSLDRLERAEDVIKFLVLAALSATVAATLALLSLAARHGLPWEDALRNWWTWWQGDVAGMLLVTPLILSWSARDGRAWPPEKKAEAACFGLLLAATAAALASDGASNLVPFSLTFVALPFIIWGAFRFGQREVTTATAVVCGVAIWYTVQRRELFGSLPLNELLLMLLTFISMVVSTGLVLVALVNERTRTIDALRAKRTELESQVRQGTYYDPLTGLPNEALFRERLAQLLEVASASDQKVAVALVDIERFKTVNDAYGRQLADELLRRIAGRLSLNIGVRNIVARTGGDRFAIAVHGFETESAVARAAEAAMARWFGDPYPLGDSELRLSARMGLALSPDDGKDPDDLFLRAESALKKAKATAEPYLFYTETMSERVAEKLSLEDRLRSAVKREEFVLHYQPKVDIDSRRIVGLEALIRWQSPESGLVSPMGFIPLLEETGMILEVGRWAFRRAMLDQALWAAQGIHVPRIAVNVSAIQLHQRNFVESVRGALDGQCMIDLEVTESRIMEDIDANIEKLRQLRALGIGIAIDDFGTGYSSLAYLAKLPVQTLKIDRIFIARMLKDDETMAVVQTIISLAQSLHLTTVAEGVESEEQADMLALLRCDQMQGYLISKPLPPEETMALLRGPG